MIAVRLVDEPAAIGGDRDDSGLAALDENAARRVENKELKAKIEAAEEAAGVRALVLKRNSLLSETYRLKAIEDGGKLDMSTWHRCGTTHCRAGWAITLAGAAGDSEVATVFRAGKRQGLYQLCNYFGVAGHVAE